MRGLLGAVCFGSALLIGGACSAATIEPVQGDLSVNQGNGFQRIDTRIDANVGDYAMVGPGGAATVTYPDGCKVNLQPGAVMAITPLSPCASGSVAQQDNTGNIGTWLAIGGFAAVVGVVGYEASQHPGSSGVQPVIQPASP
jgi:hypothetical protein